jgi:Flp pilus assembly protein TadG
VAIFSIVQVGIVVYDGVLLAHVAREAARAAAVDPSPGAARAAAEHAAPLDARRLSIAVSGGHAPGERIEVRVAYRVPTDVPLVGALLGDVLMHATATMRVE